MIVPQYWAEARLRHRTRGRQVTVRRLGWSDRSQQDAQAHAEGRAQQALAQVLAGATIARHEPRVPYNGAAGVPIREEIVARHGETVITRNAYGARCLNSPGVLFADVDLRDAPPVGQLLLVLLLPAGALLVAWAGGSWLPFLLGAAAGLLLLAPLLPRLAPSAERRAGIARAQARRRIERFVAAHPDWHLRLYRTPAGYRLLAMHRTFDPLEPAVAHCFTALQVDPIYARMCRHQRCFRARVSPKPWRIGISAHLRPRPGVWPVAEALLPQRRRWVEAYEHAARGFAACEFVAALGSRSVDRTAQAVQQWHDELCRATQRLPIA